jgi:hypothetical protein
MKYKYYLRDTKSPRKLEKSIGEKTLLPRKAWTVDTLLDSEKIRFNVSEGNVRAIRVKNGVV